MPLAISRWGVGPQSPEGGIGIAPKQDVFNGLRLLLYCRELLGKDSVTEEATLHDGGIEKANFVIIPHLSKVQPEMLLLDHHSGHHLVEDLYRDPCLL